MIGIQEIVLYLVYASMDADEFEGTLVLEKLAAIGRVEDFFEAIDSDDFSKATSLMKLARIDPDIIEVVLQKMAASED